MKYSISKILNINEIRNLYNEFIKLSRHLNAFCSQEILEYFFDDLDLYQVCKSDKVKTFVYLLKEEKNCAVSEPFIYSGIVNHPKLFMKNSRYNNEIFKINQIVVNEILSKYKKININLPLNFQDTRPFLWFNYGEKFKKR